jgi:hypothetical protein
MAELKRYTSFEGMKLDVKSGNVNQRKDIAFSEFEAFLKKLQDEYSNQKKTQTKNGKQSNR